MARKLIFLTLLIIAAMMMQARTNMRSYHNERKIAEIFESRVVHDMGQRHASRKVLNTLRYMCDGNQHLWSNGFMLFNTRYEDDSREIGIQPCEPSPDALLQDSIGVLCVRGGRVVREAGGSTHYSVERFGDYVMLVERNAAGKPVSAYYSTTLDDCNDGSWCLIPQLLLAGCYVAADSSHVVFGLRLPSYAGGRYEVDPGVLAACWPTEDYDAFNIFYGAGRVNKGDPSSPKYGKMPGGGGAGALMGPMEWRVMPTVDGLEVNVVRDEPFVDHSPRVADGALLRLVQSPYDGVDGKWAFASVFPLTHQLLRVYPKQALKLMRGEIFARHGDTFTDPETQQYFDAQPWYKPTGGKITLTDIERFNYDLIKQVELAR